MRLNRSILSPLVAFPLVWALGALLSQVHLLHAQSEWSNVMVVVVCVVPISFIAGGLIGESVATRLIPQVRRRIEVGAGSRTARMILVVLVVLGVAELVHQFIKVGSVPLLSGNIDQARFGQGGPTILFTDLLTVAAIIALTLPERLFAREHRFELGIAAVALGGFGLQAGRGALVLPVIVAVLARWLYRGRPPGWILVGAAMAAVTVVAFGFFLRAEQHPFAQPFEAELFNEVVPSMPFIVLPLVPLYLAITTNFLALQGVVGHFPAAAPYGHGVFDAYGINYFVSSGRDLGEVSALITSPWVTSTVAGPFWADGGFAGVTAGIAITGALAAGAYAAAKRTLSLRWSMVAAYFLFLALFGVYTNLWTQHVDWVVIAPALLVLGAVIEDPVSPPGVTGRVLGRISNRFESRPRPQPGNGGRKKGFKPLGPIGLSLGAIAALLVVGAITQGTLSGPYPKAATMPLPDSAARAEAMMTNSDRSNENSSLFWVNRHGSNLVLNDFDLSYTPTKLTRVAMKLPKGFNRPQYDVGTWSPIRGGALFIFQQRPDFLFTVIKSIQSGRTVARFRSPFSAPLPGIHRDLIVATYGGLKPDLYVVDRGSTRSRVRIVAVSGESGFHRVLTATYLPIRDVDPREWGVDLGPIATAPVDVIPPDHIQQRPDMLMVEHNPDQDHSIVRVMLGEDSFQGFAFQRAIEAPGMLPPSVHFMISALNGATSIFMVSTDRAGKATLDVFPLEPEASIY